jgi:hypothetical protein
VHFQQTRTRFAWRVRCIITIIFVLMRTITSLSALTATSSATGSTVIWSSAALATLDALATAASTLPTASSSFFSHHLT